MDFRFKRQVPVGAVELGLSAVTLAAERTSNKIDMVGASELGIEVQLTRGGSATRVDVAVDVSMDDPASAAPIWTQVMSESTSAGAVTVAIRVYQFTTSATSNWVLAVQNLNCRMARIRVITGAGGASASDVVTIRALKSRQA